MKMSVYVEDVDAVLDRAQSAGATVLRPIEPGSTATGSGRWRIPWAPLEPIGEPNAAELVAGDRMPSVWTVSVRVLSVQTAGWLPRSRDRSQPD